jgi:adenosine deaminase
VAPGLSLEVIRQLPKVELHLHLETSLRLHRLARERSLLDPGDSPPHLVANPAKFTGYDRLRRLRYASRAAAVPEGLYTSENVATITYGLLSAAAHQQVRYVEIRVGGRRGFAILGMQRMLEAMRQGAIRAQQTWGIRSGFIITLVRERGPEEALARVREAQACRACGVVGVDLAGDEANYPPTLFARALDLAREAGFGITVHAGEFAGPASIWTALYQLGAQRIGHGIRAVDDPELMAHLREKEIPLEVCPSSNLRLGLSASLSTHPLQTLLDYGVPVTINSDDPVLLETDISQELLAVAQTYALSQAQITKFITAAAQAAFLSTADRTRLKADLNAPKPPDAAP